jgi:hypothetical protein
LLQPLYETRNAHHKATQESLALASAQRPSQLVRGEFSVSPGATR